VEDDQSTIELLATSPVASPVPAATLSDALGRRPSTEEVAAVMFDAVRSLECSNASELELDATTRTEITRALGRYRDDCWTWRR
jgi:hypothetical protein